MLLLFPSWLRLCLLFRLLPSVEFLPAAVPHGHDLRFLLFSFFPQGLTTMASVSVYSTSPRHCDTTLANLKARNLFRLRDSKAQFHGLLACDVPVYHGASTQEHKRRRPTYLEVARKQRKQESLNITMVTQRGHPSV